MSKKTIIYLIAIVLIGAILRFYNFENSLNFSGDSGRDFLAGYLIAYENQSPHLGHYNSGINIQYPSYYYNFISYIVKINPNTLFIYSFFTTIHLLGIIIIYLIAKEFLTPKTSIATAFIYAISPFAIKISLVFLSVYFGYILFLPSILFFVKFIKNRKIINLILTSFFVAITSTIYYGAFLFFPIYFIYLTYDLYKNKAKQFEIIKTLFVFSFSFTAFFFLANFPLIKRGFLPNLIGFKQKGIIFAKNINLEKNKITFLYIARGIFYIDNIYLILIILTSFLIKTKKRRIFANIFLISFIYHVLLISIKGNPLSHYYSFIYPFFILGIGEIIDNIKNEKFLIKILFISALFAISTSLNRTYQILNSTESSYQVVTQFSKYLRKNYPFQNFEITKNAAAKGWESRPYWYENKDYLTFDLSLNEDQIGLRKNHINLHICQAYSKKIIGRKSLDHCDQFAIKYNLFFLEEVDYDWRVFRIYREKICYTES